MEGLCGAWMARLISVHLHSNWAVHISVNAPPALKESGCYKGKSKPFWNKWHRNKRGQCLKERHISGTPLFNNLLGNGKLEGVLDQLHALVSGEQVDRHHVESGFQVVGVVLVDEVQGDLGKLLLLAPVHTLLRPTEFLRSAGFHLDKGEHVAIPGDDVHLAENAPVVPE